MQHPRLLPIRPRFHAPDVWESRLEHVPISGNRLSEPDMLYLFDLEPSFSLQTVPSKGNGL